MPDEADEEPVNWAGGTMMSKTDEKFGDDRRRSIA